MENIIKSETPEDVRVSLCHLQDLRQDILDKIADIDQKMENRKLSSRGRKRKMTISKGSNEVPELGPAARTRSKTSVANITVESSKVYFI